MERYINTISQVTYNQSSVIVSYIGIKYPEIPYLDTDIYVYTTIGDRLDKLSQQYYGSTEYYWIISSANPDVGLNSLYIPEGTQIRIPLDLNNIILSFKQLNNQ
jgi:phage tail protein X